MPGAFSSSFRHWGALGSDLRPREEKPHSYPGLLAYRADSSAQVSSGFWGLLGLGLEFDGGMVQGLYIGIKV